LLLATNRLSEAEPLFRRALEIATKNYGSDHPSVAKRLESLALLLQNTDRLSEVEPLFRRALEIDEKFYGPDHPEVAAVLNNLAFLLRTDNRLGDAAPLYRRSLAILARSTRRKELGLSRVSRTESLSD
jgi:tetratricopeptide (TPR) repeat protein